MMVYQVIKGALFTITFCCVKLDMTESLDQAEVEMLLRRSEDTNRHVLIKFWWK
jgi:hypothetical protein